MKKLIALALAAFFMVGCNTMSGLGQDVQEGGKKLEASAEKHNTKR